VLPTLPVIFPELIAPVVISTLSFMVACFPSKAVCNPLVLAIVKLPSVMVGCFPSNAVCNPLVLAIVKLPSVMVGCFPSYAVSISVIFVATLVEPYNKAVEAVIVGAVIVLPTLPVIFPELIAPVVISTLSFKVACLEFKASCNPLVLSILKLPSVMVACLEFKASCNPLVLSILKLPSVMVACLVKIFVVFKSILSCNVFNED
jgi:hypothetical protein